ncbi:MAG: hypothetical protein KF878_09755 [Planctomycetes bacterium]|nr:hypothetical protein [Planctomycetota bacterium]
MPEIVLSEAERLTDRLLGRQADHTREQIGALQVAHAADVQAFVMGVAARAGVKIPPSARRIERGGQVFLSWPDPPEQPAPSTEGSPTPEGQVDA